MASPISAANAYATLARLTDPSARAGASQPGLPSGKDQSFGALLKDAIGGVIDAGRKSDAQSQAMVAGKSNIVDVVTAVSETELAIQTLVSVRDRVIQSYEDIMRMPI